MTWLTYEYASREWEKRSKRKLKTPGPRVGARTYLVKQDDKFLLVQTSRADFREEGEGLLNTWNGMAKWYKYHRLPREAEPWFKVAEIGPQETVIPNAMSRGDLRRYFGIERFKPKTIKLLGTEFQRGSEKVLSEWPIKIVDGKLTASSAPAQRVFNQDKRKELNALIKKARFALKVRAKLGGFDNVSKNTQVEPLRSTLMPNGTNNVYGTYQTSEMAYKLLIQLDENDLTSFYPFMKYCVVKHSYRDRYDDPMPSWEKMFERGINGLRERFRQASGAVSYEKVADR